MAIHRLASLGLPALFVLAHAGPASAADIASILGTPGDATFAAECPGGNVPGPFDDGIPDCPIGILGVVESDCMHRVDIDPAAYPHAVCSDGTAPSFYVRPFSDPADEHRWVIHLQGGGGCTDEETCETRWCGYEGYTAALMSNDWDANGIVDRPEQAWMLGISSNVPNNDFATWNHVYVPYCSSDLWLGRDGDVDLGDFSVAARGHTMLYAVRNMLRQLGPAWTPLGTEDYSMPVLENTAETEILFTGTSAGGYGVLQNGDWFLDKFPNARTGLVIDGAMDVDPQTLGLFGVWEENNNWPYASSRFALWQDMWDPGGWWYETDAFIDDTCATNYSLELCMSSSWILRLSIGGVPLIGTPTFLRIDLEDNVLKQWIVGPNPDDHVVTMGNGGPTPTLQDYTEMMRETAVELDADPQTDVTVFAPRCGQHVGLEHGNAFGGWTTDDTTDTLPRVAGGISDTFRDALLEWFDPGGAFVYVRRIDSDEVDPITGLPIDYSSCP